VTIAPALGAVLRALLARAGSARPATPAAPDVRPPGAHDWRAFGEAALGVGRAVLDVVEDRASAGDVETIADAALAAGLSALPGAAVFAAYAPAVVALIAEGVAAGRIRPDRNPIADAQTRASDETRGRWLR